MLLKTALKVDMSDVPKIIDLEKVVEPHLNGGKLLSYTAHNLTKAGDNYGSVMLSVKAKIQKPNGEIEDLPLVAKLPPVTNDLFWQIFQPDRTCVSENAVYQYLSPAIRQLQLEAGIKEKNMFDGFSKYYGSRISLDEQATRVDRDAVLVQENLQTSGFKAGNRIQLFDLKHSELIIKEVAKFHALPIALRLKKAKEFDENIRPYFRRMNMNKGLDKQSQKQMEKDLYEGIILATNNNDRYVERIKELWVLYDDYMTSDDPIDDLYITIVHCDLWINNLMIKYDDKGLPESVKFVDFQIAQYESLAHDIIFFLFSSVESSVLDKNFDELLHLYYETFTQCLITLGVPINDYSFVSFLKEIHRHAPLEIIHTLFMVKVSMADPSTMPDDFKDLDFSILTKNVTNKNIIERTAEILRLAEKYKFFWDK